VQLKLYEKHAEICFFFQVLSDTSASEDSDHNLELRPSIAKAKSEPSSPLAKKKTSTKKTKLFDYKDLACLEKSKRVRRRKRSEVDIEVGLRLSRFVSRPYEGAIDKYSNRKQTKTSLHPYAPNRGIWSEPSLSRSPLTSSNESSPVGSFDTRNFPSAYERSRQTDFTGESVASHLRGRRGARRRSVSASPPRSNLLFDSALHRQVGASHHTPPGVPPSQLRGPSSSPIISRYRRSTFKTILSSPDCEKIVHEGNISRFRSLLELYLVITSFPRCNICTWWAVTSSCSDCVTRRMTALISFKLLDASLNHELSKSIQGENRQILYLFTYGRSADSWY